MPVQALDDRPEALGDEVEKLLLRKEADSW